MKLRKKLVSLGLAMALIATPAGSVLEDFGVHVDLTTFAATSSAPGTTTNKTNAEQQGIIKNQDDLEYACKNGGTYTVTSSFSVSKAMVIENGKQVTLIAQGDTRTITCNKQIYCIFKVSGGSLTLGSATNQPNVAVRGVNSSGVSVELAPVMLESGILTINSGIIGRSSKVAVRVRNNSKLIMNGGYIQNVQNNNCVAGAVILSPVSSTCQASTFEMNGGTITKNNCGGVTVGKGSTFVMNGGSITDNTGGAGNPSVTPNLTIPEPSGTKCTGFGGGVFNAGTFVMNGGSISGNNADKHAGGVYNVGYFELNNGTISGNVNGGVFNVGNFGMHNGTITGNTIYSGVYNTNYFAMSGGTITGNNNTSEHVGGGVYNKGEARMDVAGSPYIDPNNEVAMYENSKLYATGALEHTPTMSVRLANPALGSTIAYTPGANGGNYVKYFNVVNLASGYSAAGDGERIAVSTVMRVSYDFDGDGNVDEYVDVPYNSQYTVRTYEAVLNKQLTKSKTYDLDTAKMRTSDGGEIAYGSTINVTSNITLTAIWTPKKYTVTFDFNGGKNSSRQESTSLETNYDKGFWVDCDNVPVREGYEFVGWATEKDAKEAKYKSSQTEKNYCENITLYAVWKAKTITITYNTASGSAIDATVGTTDELPVVTSTEPKKDGYKFAGWYDETGRKEAPGNTIKKDTTLTAKWVENGDWVVRLTKVSNSKITIREQTNTATTTYTSLNKPLTMTVNAVRQTSDGATMNAQSITYQIVNKGNTLKMTDKWIEAKDGKITIPNHKDCRIYIRASLTVEDLPFATIYESNGFSVDSKAPTISGVKNGKIYKKAVTIRVSDKVSGVKKITLNGKKIKSGKVVKKNGSYKLVAVDKSGHKKTVRFAIRK